MGPAGRKANGSEGLAIGPPKGVQARPHDTAWIYLPERKFFYVAWAGAASCTDLRRCGQPRPRWHREASGRREARTQRRQQQRPSLEVGILHRWRQVQQLMPGTCWILIG